MDRLSIERSTHPPQPLPPEAEVRDWAELPRGVLAEIFRKAGAITIMMRAQFVCRPWRELSLEPRTWRVVDMMTLDGDLEKHQLVEMAKAVIDRSDGLMEELSVYQFANNDLLKFIAERNNQLKCLRLKSCYEISNEALSNVARRSPKLEYVEVSLCSVSEEFIEAVGKACPQLKRFKFNQEWFKYSSDDEELFDMDNLEAHAIADNMQELRHLQIFGNPLTNVGLHAILDKCQKLESLDIRRCYNLKLDDERLRKKFARMMKDLRLPDEEISDREFADNCVCDSNTESDSDLLYVDSDG